MGPVILATILRSLDGNMYAETGRYSPFSNISLSEKWRLKCCDFIFLLDVTNRDVKAFAFQAIGLLAERLPSLFR